MQGTGTGSFKTRSADDEAIMRARSALLDDGRPVLAFGVIGLPSAASSPDMMTAERPSWAGTTSRTMRHLLPM